MIDNTPWQLKMFQKTLKKKLRLKALREHLGTLSDNYACLLITCGDNNGAMNYYLREIGGKWVWADFEEQSIKEMSELLNESVKHINGNGNRLPLPENIFDCVVSIDVHEHLEDPHPFTKELHRVTKLGGKVIITVPNGNESKAATRIKNVIGMTMDKYGHVREGLDIPELKSLMRENNIYPYSESSFSKFFTEMLELSINFFYVNVLSQKSKTKVNKRTIAPATRNQIKSIEKTYRMYSFVYPFFRLISMLDVIFWGSRGYVVLVEGRKE